MFHGGLSTKAHDISIQTRVQHSDDYWCGPSLCVAVDEVEVGGAREKKVWTLPSVLCCFQLVIDSQLS